MQWKASSSLLISFLNCFTLFFVIHLAKAQTVYFPGLRSNSCPEGKFVCLTVTFCTDAVKDIQKGVNPIVCGWDSEVPRVCCPYVEREITPKPRQPKKISRLSPNGCGLKHPLQNLEEDTLEYPATTTPAIETIIEPRRPSNETANPDVPELPPIDIEKFFMFAVGGQTAPIQWPWMAAIFNGDAKRQLCGGTLIDERHVVTAAHCFTGRSLDPNLYSIQIGEINLSEQNTNHAVKEIKLHEGFRGRYYYDDIAIMRLADPLTKFTAACLPAEDNIRHGDKVTVLGWGDLSYGGPSTTKLQEVMDIPVVENARCDAKFRELPGAPFPRGITDTFLCAGLEEGGKDACQGDSGGPLLQQQTEGSWTLVGVVSFGYKCGEPGYPGVYTKVSAYLPWIEKFIIDQNEVETKAKARSESFTHVNDKPIWPSVRERVVFPRH